MTPAWQVGSPGPPVGSAAAGDATTPTPIAPATNATTSFLMVLLFLGQVLPYHTRRLGSTCVLVRASTISGSRHAAARPGARRLPSRAPAALAAALSHRGRTERR